MFERVGDWKAAAEALSGLGEAVVKAYRTALRQEAEYLRGRVVEGFKAQGPEGTKWAPLGALTLAIRKERGGTGSRGDKILIVSGQMMKSVAVVEADGAIFVGIRKNKRRPDGKSVLNIALVHEFGWTYQMKQSAKQRRFLFAVMRKHGITPSGGRGGGGGGGERTVTIRIPARPMFGPVFDKYAGSPEQVGERVYARMAKLLNGRLGTP